MHKLGWVIPAAAIAVSGCVMVEGERASRTYDMAGFDNVSASHGVNVVIRQGAFAVSAEGPKERLERLEIDREGSTLRLRQKPHTSWFAMGWSYPTIITVVAPDYVSLSASGGVDMDVENLKQGALAINASGGADLNLHDANIDTLDVTASGGADINARNATLGVLTATASGGADIRISGVCRSLTAQASGGADFKGGDLRCESAVVTASGGADADVFVTASASGNASSGGDIRFHGDPITFHKEESGGGDVTAGR